MNHSALYLLISVYLPNHTQHFVSGRNKRTLKTNSLGQPGLASTRRIASGSKYLAITISAC